MKAFAEACRILFRDTNPFASVKEWRHHALGMLQGELSNEMRIHIWSPELRRMKPDGNPDAARSIHDHRFDILSYVVFGEITDVPYFVYRQIPEGRGFWPCAPAWQIRHAKTQLHDGSDFEPIGDMFFSPGRERTFGRGEVYSIGRRQWHTTRVERLSVTVIHRSNFDDKPARVLGDRTESGIVIDDSVRHEHLISICVRAATVEIGRIYGKDY